MIDDYIQDSFNKNKYEEERVLKDPKIKALKKLKRLMLSNKGDKKVFGREVKFPEKEHLKDYKIIDRSMKAFPRKKEFFLEKYMEKLEKSLVKKKPSSPQISAISTNNNYYNNTLSTNTYYNTQFFNPINTEKITTPSNNDLMSKDKDKDNNIYHNTKTSFFSLAFTNPKTIASTNNNDDLSFSTKKLIINYLK